jgi:diguanylate cyclase (GGDEF)-like protein/PAS domain S-box-containing protein
MNPIAERITGWFSDDVQGQELSEILHVYDEASNQPTEDPISICLKNEFPFRSSRSYIYRNRDGMEIKLDSTASPLRNRQENVVGAVMVFRDVTESYELEQMLEYQAKHDLLTGLTNRATFEDRLNKLLNAELYKESDYTLCYIDLDQFKLINDTCGHVAGDQLLCHVSEIMLNKIRKTHDTLARFGGDEFILLLEDCDVDQTARIANAICDGIQEYRFVYEGKTFNVGASIGVVPINSDIEDIHSALSKADSACCMAKEKGRSRMHIYSTEDKDLMQRRGEMGTISRINAALDNEGFELFYQTIKPLSPENGGGDHFEILIRMRDKEEGWIAPGFFLPAAERFNLAIKIDQWVINKTFSWLAEHPRHLEQLALCSINLSGISLSDEHLSEYIVSKLNEYSVPPEKICFEITETAAISNLSHASTFINYLRKHGCLFALDDFGSGMSSYAYLKRLPVDFLKVDGLFVKDMLNDPIDHAMVKSINEIGHVFGLKTIAEFVENEDIENILREIGLDFVQGYGIAKPERLEELPISSKLNHNKAS